MPNLLNYELLEKETSKTEVLQMPSAIEVNIFISLVIFKNKNEFFENLNYFENYVFKILFSFVMVGQNTSRSNVQRFPNPKK